MRALPLVIVVGVVAITVPDCSGRKPLARRIVYSINDYAARKYFKYQAEPLSRNALFYDRLIFMLSHSDADDLSHATILGVKINYHEEKYRVVLLWMGDDVAVDRVRFIWSDTRPDTIAVSPDIMGVWKLESRSMVTHVWLKTFDPESPVGAMLDRCRKGECCLVVQLLGPEGDSAPSNRILWYEDAKPIEVPHKVLSHNARWSPKCGTGNGTAWFITANHNNIQFHASDTDVAQYTSDRRNR